MKIIYAIVSSDDGTRVTDVLTENHFSVTRLATTGGFLKKGNATLMIGTEAEKSRPGDSADQGYLRQTPEDHL